MTGDKFIETITDRLEELGQRKTRLGEELSQINQSIQKYTAAREVYDEVHGRNGASASAGRVSNERLLGGTIADGAEAIIEESGGVARLIDITRRLREAGKLKGNPNTDYSSVVKTLQRLHERFYKVERGRWGLVRMRQVKLAGGLPPATGEVGYTQGVEPLFPDDSNGRPSGR